MRHIQSVIIPKKKEILPFFSCNSGHSGQGPVVLSWTSAIVPLYSRLHNIERCVQRCTDSTTNSTSCEVDQQLTFLGLLNNNNAVNIR
jgi:hypothetical protein